MTLDTSVEWEEAIEYQPGQQVELKQRPGEVDIIADYDPMMVPPIFLLNDPKPRYPEELRLIPRLVSRMNWLQPQTYAIAQYPACQLSDRF